MLVPTVLNKYNMQNADRNGTAKSGNGARVVPYFKLKRNRVFY